MSRCRAFGVVLVLIAGTLLALPTQATALPTQATARPADASTTVDDDAVPAPVPPVPDNGSTPAVQQAIIPDPPDYPPFPPAPIVICASGSFVYRDAGGTYRPSRRLRVEVWDSDFFADDLIGTTETDSLGFYKVCFFDNDGEGGGPEVYVKFITGNPQWRVQPHGNTYSVRTFTVNDLHGNVNYGPRTTANAAMQPAFLAFDQAYRAWVWTPGSCWDQLDSACEQLRIDWAPDRVGGQPECGGRTNCFNTGSRVVILNANTPAADPFTVFHEIGHAVMFNVYDGYFPPSNCSVHFLEGRSSTGCAWTEGFAGWYAASVLNTVVRTYPWGAQVNLETPTWGSPGWDNGDDVEGRVLGALLDLADSANEAPWDRTAEGSYGTIWYTFLRFRSNTFAEFWQQRTSLGFDASQQTLATLYQNTINYGFFEPLVPGVPLRRPAAQPNPHDYTFTTSSQLWTVVAARPSTVDDQTLTVWGAPFHGQPLGPADLSTSGAITLVAIDGHRRAPAPYYPMVTGHQPYTIELATTGTLSVGTPQTVSYGADDLVLVRDCYLPAGVTRSIQVDVRSGTPDLRLVLLGPGGSSVQTSADVLRSSDQQGPGGMEWFSYTPAVAGWYAVVLLIKSGAGSSMLVVF